MTWSKTFCEPSTHNNVEQVTNLQLQTLTLDTDKRLFVKMCGQVHCLHSLFPPATNYSLKQGHELPCYSYDLSHRSFVLRCFYEFTFCFTVFLLMSTIVSICIHFLRVLNKESIHMFNVKFPDISMTARGTPPRHSACKVLLISCQY